MNVANEGQRRPAVLITGASSGIGRAFAEVFARAQYDLMVTARRAERLEALKQDLEARYGIRVHMVVADLAQPRGPSLIMEAMEEAGLLVDVLVNNAGFGSRGFFAEAEAERMIEMVQVNVSALTALTHHCLVGMRARGRGHILNVASMAAFAPGPLMAVYYASKSYVLSFSEALANELTGSGVYVTALCPGPVQSEFQAVAFNESAVTTLRRRIPTSAETAQFGFEAMARHQVIAVAGFKNNLIPWLIRFLPRRWVVQLIRARQQRHQD